MRIPLWVRLTWPTLVLVALLAAALPASAQATRTWVSGVGDDANPCSRTAPCKTFAGAISKTATGGEINVLDPGAFGAVTITKSITISSEGFQAGVLATLGSSGIIVNAPATSIVVLRGLDIEGVGTGANGIRFLAGAALHVEDCTINNFAQKGIDFEPSGASELYVKDTIVRNSQINGVTGGGIFVKPTATGTADVSLDNVRMENNVFGLSVEGGTDATVTRSVASGNTTHGFIATGTAVGTAVIHIDSSAATNNAANGLRSFQAGATIRFSNMIITGNLRGLSFNAGALISVGGNHVQGNGTDGTPSATVAPI